MQSYAMLDDCLSSHLPIYRLLCLIAKVATFLMTRRRLYSAAFSGSAGVASLASLDSVVAAAPVSPPVGSASDDVQRV